MDINLELYKVFYYVASAELFGGFQTAFYLTVCSKPGRQNLEKKLGHTLFVRSTKRVILTPEGELLLQHVKPALSMLNEGEAVLSGEGNLTGQLRIGASDTLCRYFLIPYLRRFHKDHPEVRIKIINSTSIGCAELLENGQAELICHQLPEFPAFSPHQASDCAGIPGYLRGKSGLFHHGQIASFHGKSSGLSHPDARSKEYHQRISSSGVCSPGTEAVA